MDPTTRGFMIGKELFCVSEPSKLGMQINGGQAGAAYHQSLCGM